MKSFKTLLYFTLFPLWCFAQHLEAGLSLGTTSYNGDLTESSILDFNGLHFAYGANLRYQYNPNFALRFNVLRGKLSGDDANYSNRRNWKPQLSFTSNLTETNLMIEYHPFNQSRLELFDIDGNRISLQEAKKNSKAYDKDGTPLMYQNGFFVSYEGNGTKLVYDQLGNLSIYNKGGILMNRRFRAVLSPYLFLGAGATFTDPRVSGLPSSAEEAVEDMYSKAHFSIPFGAGLRYDFHHLWAVSLEGGLRAPFTDYLDGISESRNPDRGDWYIFLGATVSYKFSNRRPPVVHSLDADGDGTADDYDRCPNVPGTINLFGCPDEDNDGVTDAEDRCPGVSGIAEFGGCPDIDGDKVSDDVDLCPGVAGSPDNKGCPLISDEDLNKLELLSQMIKFEGKKAKLANPSLEYLDQVANLMYNYPNYNLYIEGHAFTMITSSMNQIVSENRAKACRDYLVSQGIAANRISISGLGSTKPNSKRKDNNRIEFRVMLNP